MRWIILALVLTACSDPHVRDIRYPVAKDCHVCHE